MLDPAKFNDFLFPVLEKYFDNRFFELREEISNHSKLLLTMDSRISQLSELLLKFFGLENSSNIPRFSEGAINNLQDSTGANPKEFTLKDMLKTASEQNNKKVNENYENKIPEIKTEEIKAKNNKKQTPSFGRVIGYLSNTKNDEEEPKIKENIENDSPKIAQSMREEICLDSMESSGEGHNINSIFSPSQQQKKSKELIIEPIDICDITEISNRRNSEKPTKTFGTPTSKKPKNEDLKKFIVLDPKSTGSAIKSRNILSYSVTSQSSKKPITKKKIKRPVPIEKEIKKQNSFKIDNQKALTRPATGSGIGRNGTFDSWRSLDQKRPSSPGNVKNRGNIRKIRFQEYAPVNCKIEKNSFAIKSLPKPHRPRAAVENKDSLKIAKKPQFIRKNVKPVICELSGIEQIPANCLNLISEFLGEGIPKFALCCKSIMHKFIPFKIDDLEKRTKQLQNRYVDIVFFIILHKKDARIIKTRNS